MKAFLLGGILSIHAQQFSFGAAGDFGVGNEFVATVNAVKASNVDFMLALGDLAYEPNAEQWWCSQWSNAGISQLFLSAGNHDVGEDCCGDLQAYLDNCPNTLDYQGDAGIQYYFDYPPSSPLARFLVITPGVHGDIESYSDYSRGGPNYQWLEESINDAKAQNIRWIIVAMHKVFISTLVYPDEVGSDLMNLLFSKRVDLILQAHEHGYERSKSLTCARVGAYNSSCVAELNPTVKGKGSIIVVLGTGGQVLRQRNNSDPERGYFQAVDVTTYGFGEFVVSADQIAYNFRRSAGGVFKDKFNISAASRAPSRAGGVTSTAPSSLAPTSFAPTVVNITTNTTIKNITNSTLRPTTKGNSTIRPSGNSTIRPSGNSTIRPSGNSTIRPSGNTTIRPSGNTTIRPSGNTTIRPSGNTTIRPTTNATRRPTASKAPTKRNGTLAPSARPTVFPTEEEEYPENQTLAEPATTFAYDGSAIIAVISLFLIAMGILAVLVVLLMIRNAFKKPASHDHDHGHHHQELEQELEPVAVKSSRMSRMHKKQSEGTIDYL